MSLFSRVTLAVTLLSAIAHAAVIRRSDDGANTTSPGLASVEGVLSNLPHYTPSTQKVETILALGDSYSSGEGADRPEDFIDGSSSCDRYYRGWPVQLARNTAWTSFNQGQQPELVFGACSGAKMDDLLEKQLEQGNPTKGTKYTPIGKPQIAVMTIGGNDAYFADVVNDCIIRAVFPGDCNDRLTKIENLVASTEFASHLTKTLTTAITAGRNAGGADPPESFQLYISGYTRFWNDEDTGCDDISFSFWGKDEPKLTTTLRKRMNKIVDQYNEALESVVESLKPWGAFYVHGFQEAFEGHRFCEPAPLIYQKKPVGPETWFFHQWSTNQEIGNLSESVLDALVPKPLQEEISEENPPWNVDPAFMSFDSLYTALDEKAEEQSKNTNQKRVPTAIIPAQLKRIFHPKGSAYAPWADSFMAAIRANRDSTSS